MLDERPIAEAPRDTSVVMLWCDDGIWRKARWHSGDIWLCLDGRTRIRGTSEVDRTIITAPLFAKKTRAGEKLAQAGILASTAASPTYAAK
ncbi:hypothetical protein GCM10007989_22580 [Devosia pacifica]|uniref:Uncharacterized protein n=1 Tax=Devosia pacifica TaxID=1335967 RepID=A0A918VV86_9HYPH|nr:hypothetical protein [Devosia pacifica]GHA26290.1 hypothetical protein GCM10007989_22580 [Devosia pacifica]